MSCQEAVIHTVARDPVAMTVSARATTRRMPNRSISAAANGAVSPYSARFTETARPIVPRDQSNSSCSGSMSSPGREAKPAAPMIVTKATAATAQARWTRCVRRGAPGPGAAPEAGTVAGTGTGTGAGAGTESEEGPGPGAVFVTTTVSGRPDPVRQWPD